MAVVVREAAKQIFITFAGTLTTKAFIALVKKVREASKAKIAIGSLAVYGSVKISLCVINPKVVQYGVSLLVIRNEIAQTDWSNGTYRTRHAPNPEPYVYGRFYLLETAQITGQNILSPAGEFLFGDIARAITGSSPFRPDTRTGRERIRYHLIVDEVSYRQRRGIRMRSPEPQ